MSDYDNVSHAIVGDLHYQHNLDWGETRPGHPGGSGADIPAYGDGLASLCLRLGITVCRAL
jgi:hypothetical protein